MINKGADVNAISNMSLHTPESWYEEVPTGPMTTLHLAALCSDDSDLVLSLLRKQANIEDISVDYGHIRYSHLPNCRACTAIYFRILVHNFY